MIGMDMSFSFQIMGAGVRWVLAPIYFGIFGALVLVAARFVWNFVALLPAALFLSDAHLILAILSLIDLALVANLLIMVIASAVEYLFPVTSDDSNRPTWLGKSESEDIKLRLMAAMVAISGIEVLKRFMHVADLDDRELGWALGIHLAFVGSALVLAITERLHVKGGSIERGK
jgi:uncharacterized protein (TIGR00645 family)